MEDSMGACAVVLTTAGSEREGAAIAEGLVERGLAACVNVVPGIRSVYRWKGALQRDEEHLLLIKTSRALFPEVRDAILELHTYELPEIVLLPIADGESRYLDWIVGSLRPC